MGERKFQVVRTGFPAFFKFEGKLYMEEFDIDLNEHLWVETDPETVRRWIRNDRDRIWVNAWGFMRKGEKTAEELEMNLEPPYLYELGTVYKGVPFYSRRQELIGGAERLDSDIEKWVFAEMADQIEKMVGEYDFG